ncbi:hypothetical protein PPL_09586 [Heterostelium album PN500]|uniref:Uncharacterized protein n=1 Tax=Heterostelium pallidum (strain ATCC 26659 / Pp 5 / PN500) TaxID=670386 RepID=D3BNR5_HETP5|nr:hypothetical protein PPL_09586 [Heterostelium album PN500]EFA76834.1 hypothetical protein PPL_09586 [Heterostelium album PN500]|eukprot:XP_020428966.1 hypothetical protein PPL_09586 [Heterostelium album PN500]
MSAELLKEVSPSVAKVASGIWAKSIEQDGAQQSDNPTHPYTVTLVQQYAPPRAIVERFELRRNELERSMPAGKRLETLNCFFVPSSEGQLRKLIINGWLATFESAADIVFYQNANKAIQEQQVPYPLMVVARVCLGREGIDHTVANGRIRVRDLSSVITSFLLSYKTASSTGTNGLSSSGGSAPPSPFKVNVESPSASPIKSPISKPLYPSGQLSGDGKTCPSCNRENAGNTRYCVRCGGHL